MNAVESYRTQIAAKQNRHLLIYLTVAVALHTAAAVAFALWSRGVFQLSPSATEAERPTPIEFVAIESDDSATPPPTNRQAQTNSTAGGEARPERPTQAGAVPQLAASPLPKVIATPFQPPVIASPSPQPTPAIVKSPAKSPAAAPASPARPLARATPSTSPQPVSGSPLPASPLPTSPPPTAASPVSPSPIIPTSPNPAPPTTTQLGAPLTRSISIEGQGLDGELNPDRLATGTGVDAVRDDLWGTYLTRLNQTVDQHWQRVAVATTRRTRIQFRVNRQGRLTDLRVLQSSGDTLADQAAVQAIRAAAPFAPLPQNASEEVLIVNFTFTQWLSPPP